MWNSRRCKSICPNTSMIWWRKLGIPPRFVLRRPLSLQRWRKFRQQLKMQLAFHRLESKKRNPLRSGFNPLPRNLRRPLSTQLLPLKPLEARLEGPFQLLQCLPRHNVKSKLRTNPCLPNERRRHVGRGAPPFNHRPKAKMKTLTILFWLASK